MENNIEYLVKAEIDAFKECYYDTPSILSLLDKIRDKYLDKVLELVKKNRTKSKEDIIDIIDECIDKIATKIKEGEL